MAFTYGRRPPKKARALPFSAFHTGRIPEPAAVPADRLSTLGGWQVLGNDTSRDCTAAAWANNRRFVSSALADAEYYPTQEQVWDFYRTQNPRFDPCGGAATDGPGSPADQGMELQTGLEYLHVNDGPDGVRAVAFAQVDPTNMKEVEAAITIFGSLWLGILVERANPAQFRSGTPWTDIPRSPVQAGHTVICGGHPPDADAGTDSTFITWGRQASLTPSFWNGSRRGQRLVEEAWIVIWPEHLDQEAFLEGVDQDALRRSYRALTGRTLAVHL